MQGVTVQHLRFHVRARESILFEDQPGAALRGALYQVLADNFCSEAFGPVTPEHSAHCPVCWLLAGEDPDAGRGQNIPRALSVEPPLDQAIWHEGDELVFGFSLIGRARDLLPYIARAAEKMGSVGVGRGRGRFKLEGISEFNPCLDVERTLLDGRLVKRPTLQITPAQITDHTTRLSKTHLTIELLTPTRLTAGEQLIKTPDPVVLMKRLLERCQNLANHFAEIAPGQQLPTREEWRATDDSLAVAARGLRLTYNETRWIEARSGSRRTGRTTPISGLVGRFRWEGELATILPWILWGQSLHVGKNAVKGNGWYRVIQ
jgi:hypothetical protein